MTEPVLDLGALRKSVTSLEEAWQVWINRELLNQLNPAVQHTIRAGVIQNFEFTYEASWKFIKRWLAYNVSPDEVEAVTRQQLFRIAAKHLLIDDVKAWMRFHKYRNLTSHTYNQAVAKEVSEVAGEFLGHAKQLLAQLEKYND